jgi:hypothetical protein
LSLPLGRFHHPSSSCGGAPSGGQEIPSQCGLHRQQVREEGEPAGRRERRAPIGTRVVQTGDQKAQRGGGVRRASVLIFFREVDKIIRIGVFLTNFFFFFFD